MAFKKLLKKLKGAGEALGVGQDKEQWEKTKAKRKKAGKWTPGKYAKKAAKQVVKDVKSAAKGSKEYQAAKAKKKEGKTWTKAVKAQKKTGGASMNELIKARNAAKASGDKGAYAKAQNQINEAYGSKKVHKADAPKKAEKKKVAAKPDVRKIVKNLAKSKPKSPDIGQSDERPIGPVQKSGKYAEGGKVDSNPYGWPSSDSRKR